MSDLDVQNINSKTGNSAISIADDGSVSLSTSFSTVGIDDNATSTAITIDSSENVGIGTTSPSRPLHVNSGATNAGIKTQSTDAGAYIEFEDDSSTTNPLVGAVGNDAVIITNSSERMRIDSSGNVGIGTTGPISPLSVVAASGGGAIDVFGRSADGLGWITYRTNNGSSSHALIGTPATNTLAFYTNGFSERMRLNSLGALCVGLTNSTIGSGNVIVNEGVYVGAANGDNQIRSSSAGGGSATLYIGNAAIQVSSDRRLKENIVDTSMSALEKLDQVRVVDFTWNDPSDTAVNNRNARGVWTGIIAQELVDVFPFAVNAPRNEDDLSIDEQSESTWQVDQDQLVPVLIKAIQELKAEVAALKGA